MNPIDYCDLTKKLFATLGAVLEQVDCGTYNDVLVEEGDGILLAAGDKDITFKTDFKPERVYVSVSSEGLPVCVGDRNEVSTTLLEDGFVLHASIKTDHATVRWIIKKTPVA
jgi:hypothetical protein